MSGVFRDIHDTNSRLRASRCPRQSSCLRQGFGRLLSSTGIATKAVKLQDAKYHSDLQVSRPAPSESPAGHGALATPSTKPPSKADISPSDIAVSKYLISAIMASHSWEKLQDLVKKYGPSFNQIHLSALVCRLPKLVVPDHLEPAEKARFNSFLRSISDMVSFRLPTFDPRALANVLWAVSKLGFSPAPPLLNKFLFEAYVQMYKFKAQELANLAWALATLAKMGNCPVPVWLSKFTQAAVLQVTYLKPQEVAHMSWALSKLFRPEAKPSSVPVTFATPRSSDAAVQTADSLPKLVAALAAHATAQLHRFRCGELVMVLVGLHELDPHVGAQLMRRALPHLLAASGDQLSTQDLVQLWTVVGKCAAAGLLPEALPASCGGRPPLRLSHPNGVVGVHSVGSSSPPELGAVRPVPITEAAVESSWASGASALLEVPVALESCHTSPALDLHSAAGAAVAAKELQPQRSRVRGANPVPAPPACQSHPSLRRAHLGRLYDLTQRSLGTFTMDGLATTLVAWARLRVRPHDDVAAALIQRYREVTPTQSSFQAVAITIWAAGRLGMRLEPDVMELLAWCGGLQLATAKPDELVALLWGLQELAYRPGRVFFRRLSTRLDEVAGALLPHGLHTVIKAYTVFGEPLSPGVRRAALEVATGLAVNTEAPAKPRRYASALAAGATGAAGGVSALQEPRLRVAARHAARYVGQSALASASGADTEVVAEAASKDHAVVAVAEAAAAAPSPTTGVGKPRSGAPRLRLGSTMSPLQVSSPSAVVRFLATLAGYGLPQPLGSSRRILSDFTTQCIRWRLGRNDARRRALRNAVESALWDRLGALSNDALCALLLSMKRLSMDPRPSFLLRVHHEVALRAETLAPWQAGALLTALSRMRSAPRPNWLEAVLSSLEPQFHLLRGHQLAGILLALARLRYRPSSGWMRSYFAACMARLDAWPVEGVGILLRSMAALGIKLKTAPCQRLRAVVARSVLLRQEEEAERRQRGMTDVRERVLAGLPGVAEWEERTKRDADLGTSLCQVCDELEQCSVSREEGPQ